MQIRWLDGLNLSPHDKDAYEGLSDLPLSKDRQTLLSISKQNDFNFINL